MFAEALAPGGMECFFPLIEHFRSPSAFPHAFCGLGTLVTVLNALKIDPHRKWKGPWRHWHESLLDCCEPLDKVKEQGIVFPRLVCLARCNGAHIEAYTPAESSEDAFRQLVRRSASCVVIVSYSRKQFARREHEV